MNLVQPVAMRSAVFCVVCNLSMCVSAVSGCSLLNAHSINNKACRFHDLIGDSKFDLLFLTETWRQTSDISPAF